MFNKVYVFLNSKLNYSKSIEIKPLHQDMAETDKIIELGRELGFLGQFLIRFTSLQVLKCYTLVSARQIALPLALSRFTIHTPEEAKIGISICVYCCPICTYVVKNNTTFLDHIIVGHYWGSFSCGKCLAFAVDTAEQMMGHLPHCRQSDTERHKARSPHSKAHLDCTSSRKSQEGKKKKEGASATKRKKPCGSPTESNPVAPSQEQAKRQ